MSFEGHASIICSTISFCFEDDKKTHPKCTHSKTILKITYGKMMSFEGHTSIICPIFVLQFHFVLGMTKKFDRLDS